MLHNRSMEDTLGPRWPNNHPQSTDSLFYPDICLSTHKRTNQDYAAKRSPVRGTTRETPQKSIYESPVIEDRGSYYINKRYGSAAGHEKTRRSSLSFLIENSDKKKDKKEKSVQEKGDYKLQVKIEGLKNLIKTEKEMMIGLKKKISSEKSELSMLQQKLEVNKLKTKKKSKKSLELNKSALALMESTNRQLDRLEESVLSKRPPAVTESILKKRTSLASTVVYESVNRSMSVLRDSPIKWTRTSIDNRRGSLYDEKMSVLEDSIKQLKSRYEEEIGGLRNKLGELKNENTRLKESTAYDKGCERIQVLQARRLQDLVETLGKKERELVVQERYYKEQIDGMGMKVISLNDEMERALRNQEKLKELESQMESKHNDIEIMKNYFVEKLKSNVEDHYNQKKEWTWMHTELVKEVNSLKVKENAAPHVRASYVKENKYKGKGHRI